MNPREKRLQVEFERMFAIQKEHGLIRFTCGDMTAEESSAFLSPSFSPEVINRGFQKLLSPEEFMQRYPGRGPEKYLIQFSCTGLKRNDDGTIVETTEHFLEVAFAYNFPAVQPLYIWLTPIWHPNILPPYFCKDGRPFAAGTTLDQVCMMAGHMIQYKNFNPASYLNLEAAQWAEKNRERLPVDKRDLLGGAEYARPLVLFNRGEEEPPASSPQGAERRLVEIV